MTSKRFLLIRSKKTVSDFPSESVAEPQKSESREGRVWAIKSTLTRRPTILMLLTTMVLGVSADFLPGLFAQQSYGASASSVTPSGASSYPAPTLQPPRQIPLVQETPENKSDDKNNPANLVLDVKASGNNQIPMTTILEIIKTRKGRPYSESTIEEDKRSLMQKPWFIDVRPLIEKTPEGYIVTFQFIERQQLHYVKFLGNLKHSKKRLLEESGLSAGAALDPIAVHQAKDRLETFYQMEGFYQTHIEIMSGDKIGDRGAIFYIDEGIKQRILKVEFRGNTISSGAVLKLKIDSKPGFAWYFGGPFNRELLKQDVEKLTTYYRNLGFFYAKVDYDFEECEGYSGLGEPNSWIKLVFLIDEGPRCKIRDIRFVGNKLYDHRELLKCIKSKLKDYYYQDMVDIDMGRIREKYGIVGYVHADATPDPRIEDDQIDLVVQIKEGPQCRVGEIKVEIVGVDGMESYTSINTVMNPLSFKPGDLMNIKRLNDSKRRLIASRVFESNPAVGALPDIQFSIPEQWLADEERRQQREESGEGPQIASPGVSNIRGQSPGPASGYVPSSPSPSSTNDLEELGRFFRIRPIRHSEPVPEIRPVPQPMPQSVQPAPFPVLYRGRQAVPTYAAPVSRQTPVDRQACQRTEPVRHTVYRNPLILGQQAYGTPTATAYDPYNSTSPPASAYADDPRLAALPAAPPAPAVQSSDSLYYGSITYPPSQGAAPVTQPSIASQPYPSPYTPAASGTYAPSPSPVQAPTSQYVAPQYSATQPPVPQYAPLPVPSEQYNTSHPVPASNPASITQPGTNPYANPYGSVSNSSVRNPGHSPADVGLYPMSDPAAAPKPINPIYTSDVKIVAHETRTGSLMMSVAVNSDSGLMGRFAIEEQNFDIMRWPKSFWRLEDWKNAFRGRGQRFRIEAVPGEHVQRYEVSWQTPYLCNLDYSLSLSGYYYQRFYDEWYEDRVGGTIGIGKNWTKDFSTVLSYNGGRINVYHPEYPVEDLYKALGHHDFHTFGLTAMHDTRDSTFLATEGHLLSASLEQTVGKHQFLRGGVDFRKYFLLRERPDRGGRWVLGLRSAASLTEGHTPIYERYFSGGFSSIRGFEYRSVSPRDKDYDMVVGGCFEFYNSAELVFPITADDMVRGLLFVDSGTVESKIDNWQSNYRCSVGFGLRITIPMMGPAPIALDFAFPLSKDPRDKDQLFTFNVGFFR